MFDHQDDSKSFFNLSFKKARRFLPTIYLDLGFLKHLELDIKNFDIKFIYTNTSIMPSIQINNQYNGKPYLKILPSELELKEKNFSYPTSFMHLGYKHFDKCKLPNGKEMGDLKTSLDKDYLASKRIKKLIQKRVLGWKYWLYKFKGE